MTPTTFSSPNGEPFQITERVTRVAPLGLRFWDPLTGAVVGTGLNVSAYLPAQPDQPVQASANRSGVYTFHHLPLLQEVENGSGDQDFWSHLPPRLVFRVEVNDPLQRFLPLRFNASLPFQGLFAPDCSSILSPPPPKSDLIPLFSAPTRTAPAGMAVVRAELRHLGDNQPVAWALVEITPPGRPPVSGLANSQGQVVILFPYPEPQGIGITSPPGPGSPPVSSGRRPLTQQTWTVKVQVFARPGGPLTSPLSPPAGGAASGEEIPDLCQILKQRQGPPASAWGSLSPLAPLGDQILAYGKELVISSLPFQGSTRPLSELMLTLV